MLVDTLIASGALSQAAVDASGLLPDAYTLFARELIAAGHDPVTVMPDANDRISTTVVPFEGDYDLYVRSSNTVEEALVDALKLYVANCPPSCHRDGHHSARKNGHGGRNEV